jgi:hypothetical protein
MPESSEEFECVLPDGKGEVYLSARRVKDGRILQFAHDGQANGRLFLGHLI